MPVSVPFYYDYVLPNICLPNATPPQMGIINYIHTLYSNKLNQQSYFDCDIDDPKGPMMGLLGGQFGYMPNSIWNNGTYLSQDCFSSHIDVQNNSMFFGKQRFKKYVYPIKVNLHFQDFTGVNQNRYSRLEGEYFWKYMSEEALIDARRKQSVILLDWANENFIEKHEFDNFHKSLDRCQIDKSQIILTINSFNADEVYNSWYQEHERKVTVVNLPFLIYHTSYHYNISKSGFTPDIIFRSTRNKQREFYFTYKIKRAREHRINILYKLAADQCLDKADWSLLDKEGLNRGVNLHRYGFAHDPNLIQSINAKVPKTLIDEPTASNDNTHGWSEVNFKPYLNSYFYLCTETYHHAPYKSLTEKIFKPLANFKPIIFYGPQGSLEILRKLGFQTFSPHIDESYDNESDDNRRMHMVCAEVHRLCQMTPEQIHQWYWDMEEIYYHNRKTLLEFYERPEYVGPIVNLLHERTR
ncbi:MAG: hypothetical protein EBU90_07060 [Proteobacteria bacterium]|nr:hypothetical protein [Pseudomonadota bacterium]NBP14173.1 hypothetical protein [bacterium]